MGLIKFILNSDSRSSLRKIKAQTEKVLALAPKYEKMSDEELKNQTDVLKDRLKKGETLEDIMFDAFAVVREASYRVLNMRHYPVQIMGGICVHQGRVAELKTGEGKTLMATLPAYLNALSEKGVHIVTVNDYLAKRDSEWMGKVYRFLGLTVGVNTHDMTDEQKRAAYACDITYGTNNEFGFDYLRDNLKIRMSDMVQRGLNFAIVDEVDSILIDEARTPLIISGRGEKSSTLYYDCNRFVKTLVADEDYTVDVEDKTVQITENGARKAEKFFGIENLADIENSELNHHIQQALKAHFIFKRDSDYIVSDGEIIIVDEFTGRLMIGRRYSEGLHQAIEAKENVTVRNENKTYATITFQNYFRLYHKLSGMTGTAKTEEEEFRTIYGLDVLEIPTNKPVQRIDLPDVIYSTAAGKTRAIVKEIIERHATGQPILVGTVTVEKSEEISRWLIKNKVKHNILNAKNHKREAEIIAQAGKKGAVTIATNMAGRGTDILLGGNPEFMAIQDLRNEGISDELINVATSYVQNVTDEQKAVREKYREYLKEHEEVTEAEKKEVVALGGLHIIGTERHESRRIDNQLRGRSGRQGDPGSSLFFISLEDDLAKRFGGERLQSIYRAFKVDEDTPLQSKMLSRSIENAQKTIEGKNFGIRKHIIEYDDVMNLQRKIIYEERMKVLRGDDVHQDVLNLIPDYVGDIIRNNADMKQSPVDWDKDKLNKALEDRALPRDTAFITDEVLENWDAEYIIEKAVEKVIACYEEKIAGYKEQGLDFSEFERFIFLKVVDNKWIDHIDAMDKLKRGISLRGYANEDPVIAYKKEGLEMFEEMTASIQEDVVSLLLKSELKKVEEPKAEKRDLVENGGANDGSRSNSPIVKTSTIGRNDPCPCGSGKKFKNCCGRNQ
ncbi:MAG: preprotein translocase subunit SecA [Clostridia bacterium]|nr:preprotein translocase subunit SecA [Clostridia bacterium]MDY2713729.1 preprotein translocase subunit SecA [Christensenellaceae bacterium]MDY3724885.1 preprotein translocase subunit SecA [Christensenellaceae bacterium]